MNFFKELNEFKKIFLPWLYFFLGATLFFFLFGGQKVEFRGISLFLPVPTLSSFSAQFFYKIQEQLLPKGITIIATNPLTPFLAQMTIALFLGFVFTLPLLLYRIVKYLSLALYEHERRTIAKILIPSIILFGLGCVFAYFFLIPLTFKMLYPFAKAMGVTQFFAINEFIVLTLVFMIAVGVIFLFPVFMVLLSYFGIIKVDFWKKNWRSALVAILIFSAVITPDNSGITMVLLFLPLTGLYFLGYIISIIIQKKGGKK